MSAQSRWHGEVVVEVHVAAVAEALPSVCPLRGS